MARRWLSEYSNGNRHRALAALTPTVTCLIAITLQRQDTRDLCGEMIALRNLVRSDMLMIHERVAKVEGKSGR